MGRHGKGLGLGSSKSPKFAKRGVRSVSLSEGDMVVGSLMTWILVQYAHQSWAGRLAEDAVPLGTCLSTTNPNMTFPFSYKCKVAILQLVFYSCEQAVRR